MIIQALLGIIKVQLYSGDAIAITPKIQEKLLKNPVIIFARIESMSITV
ncbi:hypothetical protein PL11201_80025 [Planktothrix sp. PCC 11201]|nr:hypothetical protein [Planktothrix sp. PCC 11201]SKB15716.1 hypothetical protein PL11201_80025 [Planktothrix sp. PCC 11201]